MDKEEKEVTLEDLYWATLSKNDIIRILKDNCSKNIILEKQKAYLEAKLAEYEEIMEKHNIVGISKLDACLRDYLDINEDTMCGKMIKKLKQQLTEKEKEIAELEKTKELAETLFKEFCQSWEYQQRAFRGHRHIEYYDLIKGIDQQIKELKGGK